MFYLKDTLRRDTPTVVGSTLNVYSVLIHLWDPKPEGQLDKISTEFNLNKHGLSTKQIRRGGLCLTDTLSFVGMVYIPSFQICYLKKIDVTALQAV